MLKIACFLTGDNYKLVSEDTPGSKKKIVGLALALTVPVAIWFFNGFMLAHTVVKSGVLWSILTAIACGGVVFVIEKLIIMANGNGWLTFTRICIGLLVALLGSITIDEVFCKGDIDTQVGILRDEAIEQAKDNAEQRFKKSNDYTSLDHKIGEAQMKYDNAVATVIAEADGSGGTKARGIGNVTRLKDQTAQNRKAELEGLIARSLILKRAKDSVGIGARNLASKNFNENALLLRIKALFQLVASNSNMLFFYILFTLLMFFVEFLVVIFKRTWKKTNYERKLEMIEEIGQKRMAFLQSKDSPLTDPGSYLSQFHHARNSLKKNSSLFN